MKTGTPVSNPGARRYFQRPGPRAPGGRGHAKLATTGRPVGPHTAKGLVGSRAAVWLAMAAMLAIIIAFAMFQGAPLAQAAAGDATGQPGIVDQANPGVSLTTVRPGMTLLAKTTDIMDPDDLTNPGWTYQWNHIDTDLNQTDISGATSATYLVKESDIGKAFAVSVTFTDDNSHTEGPLTSPLTHFVGPVGLIVWGTQDPVAVTTTPLTETTSKLSQSFISSSSAESYTLDSVQLTFGAIGDTATAGSGITITLNADSFGSPGGVLCTLTDPSTFSSSGGHKFTAPKATISSRCPQLVASTAYHVVIEKDSSHSGSITITHDLSIGTGSKGTGHGSALGWTINGPSKSYASSTWTDHSADVAMLIDVRARLTEFELEALTETEVPFGWGLTPPGVAGGEKFRLMFLTDVEKPTSTDINVYNEFVQAQAAGGHTDIQEHANQFRVLGSTDDDDARDNTETTSSDTDAPIYWLGGDKIANDYQTLYSSRWEQEEDGRTKDGIHIETGKVWTGSEQDGTGASPSGVSVAFGQTSVRTGELQSSVISGRHALDDSTDSAPTTGLPFYALSGIFVVEPNTPATATAAITGTPRVGETLTAALSDISDTQGATNIAPSYQWTRDDGMNVTDIDGATSETYVLTDADAEHQVNVKITFEDDFHNVEGPFTATATEAVVPTEVLVRNIGQIPESAGEDFDNLSPTKIAQAFTTGANSDGYALTSIGVHFHTIANTNTAASRITATLNENSSGLPGAALCTLTDPPSFSASGLHAFTAPATDRCTVLEANTIYWVALVNDAFHQTRLTVTTSSNEDSGGVADWLIADSHHQFTGSNQWVNYLDAILIEFRGENAVPNATATGVPTIDGTPQEGSALTADTSGIADGNGLGTFKYQWVRVTGTVQTDIDGATASTYTLTEEDLDRTVIVKVSFIDQDGHPEGPLSSAATGIVTAPNLLVKNTLAGVNAIPTQASDPRIGQAFTTGSSLGGYQLASVGFRLHAIDDPASAGTDLEVTLNEVATSGEPGAALCTLEDPGTFVANSINRFTAPSGEDCPILSRNTTYFAVLHRVAFTGSNAITIGVATSQGEDDGSAANWSIADTGYFGAGTTWSTAILNYRIEVTGEEGIEVEVPQGWSLTPSGLVGGDRFRLLFLTEPAVATDTDIADYNTYVQQQAAAGHTDIQDFSSWFRVLGSTEDVDARDNTGTTSANPNSEIYWLNGSRVANNYGNLYRSFWDEEANPRNRAGTIASTTTVWTGSRNDGTASLSGPVHNQQNAGLGATSVRTGELNSGLDSPLHGVTQSNTNQYPFYALSNIFVVPNSDATGQPAITGKPRVNETLTADTSGITDPEGTDNAVFTYQWIRVDGNDETDIDGATRATYRPNDEDADKKLKVRISFTDNQGFEEGPLVSEPTTFIIARDVLVSNRTPDTHLDLGFTVAAPITAQGFTTGTEADGYTLESVSVAITTTGDLSSVGPKITATIRAESSGAPGTTLCTLVDPQTFIQGYYTFTAPSTGTPCPVLSANTTYFFAIEDEDPTASPSVSLRATNSNSEDAGSRTGWLILDDNHYFESTWKTDSSSIKIEVKGRSSAQEIESDHTTWVDNRQGDADTDYENLGSYSIAQGFRTGDTAGIFNVNEIHIDFDSGQTEYQKITLLITESTTPDAEVNTGRPSGFRKGGSFYSQEVDSDGTVTFPRHSGYKWLEANTNYFLIISSTSNDPDAAPTLRMTEYEGQDSSDGWSIDDQSYSKAKAGGARWTQQDHQVRFRISGEYHQGLSLYLEPSKYESCPNKPCVVAVLQTDENMGMEGRRFPGSLDSTTTTWISTQENIEFKAALWPIPTAGQWVEFDYNTSGWTATAGEDFINTQGTVLFSAGDKLNTIKVELIDDSIEDSGEQLRMRIGVYLTTTSDAGRTYQPGDFKVRTGGGYPFPEVTKYSAFGTILNSEEETETRWLKVSGATITEGVETAAQFTVSLTGTLTAPVWFNYATVDGSAIADTHYTATSGETHIPHGATSVTVSVPILDFDDDVYTGDRQFTLQLSNITVAAVGTDSATATIRDDEPQPLTASFTNLPEGNHGESTFKFDINFNQDVATRRLVMQEDVMTVTGGEITGAQRVDGAKSLWRITTQPVDGRDVTVELPVTTDCSATGAVCTGGDSPQPLSNSVTHTFLGTQLNAEFEGFDHYHDGSTPMQFRVVFSEEVDTTAAEIKEHALTVTGATVNTVVQKDEGSTRKWDVTVTPAGTGPFDVILASATDCAQDGHICTPGGELLAQGDWKRSSGPPVISVADAAVTEGDGAQLAFAITLDRNWSGPIPTVSYATSDGTASAGSDYTAGSGSLTLGWTHTGSLIRPWILAGTITVPVTNDTVVEETETLTLTLSSPVWATLGDAVATGTIEEDDVAVVREPDSAPTGLPTITGTPQADSALTADTSAIDDANGLTKVSYTYQWIVTTDGTDANIDGATASTYTPRAAHVGKTFKARVSFTDDDDYQHTLTSKPTTPITQNTDAIVWSADMLVVAYTAVSIGAASADLFSNVGGTGDLQIKSLWSYVPDSDLRLAFTDTFDDAGDHQLIVGDLTLAFPADSSGEQSFKWTGVDLDWEDGETIAVSIVPATPPEPVANTAATGLPTVSGTPQVGVTLTADVAVITDADGLDRVSYNYQWLAGDANIQHATARTHTPGVSDVGKTIRVRVSFTDDRGNAESLTSIATAAVLATVPTAPLGLTVTTGDQVQELDASWQAPSSNGGSTVTGYRVHWKEAADRWDTAADVSRATVTGTTHTITGLTGGVEYAVRVMATNGAGDGPASAEARGTPAAENNAPTGLPGISGTAQVGETLTASTSNIEDEDGLDNVSYRYQWLRNDGTDDADIAGGTGSTHTLADADQGQTISVKVSFTDDRGNEESLTSAATGTVLARANTPAAGLPTISGTPQVEQTLTADTSSITDEDGLTNASYAYQWSAGGSDIDGATGSSYNLTASEQGQTIQVQVTFTDDANNEETLTSQATVAVAAAPNRDATGAPTIGGTPQVGETLTADTSGVTDADGLTNVSYAYQWSAGGTDIPGATGAGFTLTASEQGKTIQVRVTFTDDRDNSETLTSAATTVVLPAVPTAPTSLSATTGTGAGAIETSWQPPTSNGGAAVSSYRLQWKASSGDWNTPADVSQATVTGTSHTITGLTAGAAHTVRVAAANSAGHGPNSSEATASAGAAPAEEEEPEPANSPAGGVLTISGTPQVEETLAADVTGITDGNGLDNVAWQYQWSAGGTDIAGATGSSLTLTTAEQGETVQVKVTFTDDAGNTESLTSAATDAVAAKPVPLTVSFSNVPAGHSGSGEFTFDLTFSENFPLSYRTLRDHAFTEDDNGPVTKAQRKAQGSNQTWTITIEPKGNGAITITLPATTDCAATGAICTSDGRKLSNSTTVTVPGPQ